MGVKYNVSLIYFFLAIADTSALLMDFQ